MEWKTISSVQHRTAFGPSLGFITSSVTKQSRWHRRHQALLSFTTLSALQESCAVYLYWQRHSTRVTQRRCEYCICGNLSLPQQLKRNTCGAAARILLQTWRVHHRLRLHRKAAGEHWRIARYSGLPLNIHLGFWAVMRTTLCNDP